MFEATPDTTLEANLLNRVALGDTLHRSARKFGAKKALVDGPRRISYAELNADSNRYAHHLLASGLKPGDKVAMVCGNSAQFLVAAYGILKAGLVWVPINAMLAPDDVRYILEHAEARHVIVDAPLLPPLRDTLAALNLPVHVGFGEPAVGGPLTVAQALQGHADTLPAVIIDERDLALIMYTSGTTGRPKGAMHSHRSVHAALMSNIAGLNLNAADVFSCLLPMFHCAQFATAASAITLGATLVIQRGFDPAMLLDAIATERITQLFGLPLMYAALLHHPLRAQRDLSSLRLCLYAMAPMAKPLLERLIAEVCPNFALGSGQTEIFPMTMYFAPDQQLRHTGNYWGQPCMVNEAAVMDDQGNLLGPGQLGEIVHRGPNVMLGYYKDPQATANARRFGWHHTGDLGMWDDDGQLQFKDRIKDMIKTGGENVPSVKVEEVLLRHPAVANAAVVGLPHVHWVEAVAAFVCLKPDAQADAAALQAHCREHLAGFEVPKHIAVVDKLPMTATGKIQKHVLRGANQALFDVDAR
ncbi:AMP-binding protein [Ralstonia sp. UBA689]|uniref:AMP-binding protein n=1 Tax=Ralstonia sp. UBA689 TaxID=1947373 RepID=UPI0025D99875|nr:AMP-binding protein [Ralstonia sp. UBA689]